MWTSRLDPGLEGGSVARLRELTGRDELAVAGRDGVAATELLGRLLVDTPGTTVGPSTVWRLALVDRDRLLAEVYRVHFGDRVEGAHRCEGCGEPFELAFSLAALQADAATAREDAPRCTGPDARGFYALDGGRRFRLPTSEDRQAVANLPPEAEADERVHALLRRCVEGGDPGDDAERIQAAMAQAGPLLDVDLDASCPACGHAQRTRFDIVRQLMGALAHERGFLTREVHCLAKAYGWGLDEILALPRSERRALVRLNEATGGSSWAI